MKNIHISVPSVRFSRSVMSDSLRLHELQHSRPRCPSPTPGVHPNPCPLSRWCHPTISSSVVPFSSCLQSFPASGSLPMSQLFAWGGQSIGVSASASVLPMNIHWFPSGQTGLISLQSKGLSRWSYSVLDLVSSHPLTMRKQIQTLSRLTRSHNSGINSCTDFSIWIKISWNMLKWLLWNLSVHNMLNRTSFQ